MTRRQLFLLCLCNFVILAVGTGLMGLMPVYISRLGADPSTTGLFFAFAFLSLAISAVVAGRLADRFQRRRLLLIVGGVLAVPGAWLMGEVTTLPLLMFLAAFVWFAAGFVATMVNTLMGLFSDADQRGRNFGLLGSMVSLGAVCSGLVTGPLVDRWGFPALFTLSALLYLVLPIAGFFVQDKVVTPVPRDLNTPPPRSIFTNRTFLFLFFASILSHVAGSGFLLARPLIMDSLQFDATAIASTGSAGGLVALPIPFLIGWLSDRLGRKPFIVLCYLSTITGLFILASAVDLWHFWAASGLQAILAVSLVVGSALITDISPRETLGASLALFNATAWIGFVIGFGGGGAAMSTFQIIPSLMIGVLLTLVAIGLLIPVSGRKPQLQVDTA